MNRRQFVRTSAWAAGAAPLVNLARAAGANDKVILGVMGCGGRGTYLAQAFARRADTEVAWLCDPDRRKLTRAAAAIAEVQQRPPQVAQDFRRILEDKSVDALVNATPDHWHGLGTILACQAGKDVFVEKPLAHNLREGRRMIEVARRHGRVIQVGTQSRSAPYARAAKDYIQSGKLGAVHLVRVFNLMQHSFVTPGPNRAEPEELDYDLWCGPAARLPYNPTRYWLNYSEYSCGPIPGDAVHQLDLARYVMGDPTHPRGSSHTGGIHVLKDGRDTPDTQFAMFDYGEFTLSFEGALWTPYMQKTPVSVRDSDAFPNWPFSATKIEVVGTRGLMLLGRHGGGWQVCDAHQQLVESRPGRQADREHQDDFIACVRSRAQPIADVEQGHYSTALCHLANIAWRAGLPALRLDPVSETFAETPAANEFLGRSYRAPWKLPEG